MSFNIKVVVETGGPEPCVVEEVGSPTYNISPMFILAFGEPGIRALDWELCLGATDAVELAYAHISDPDNRDAYVKLNPANGWGSHDTAKSFIAALLASCRRHPLAYIRVT